MNLDIKYYISVFFRRFPIFFIVTALFSAIAISAAFLLPTTYEAQARLLVESPQIPDDMAASTVQTNAPEQLEIFEQRLMTRANLLDIANKRRVFDHQDTMSPDEIVQAMHDKTDIRRASGRERATMMTLTFRATKPRTAAQVTNDFVSIVQQDSVQFRTGQAETTLAFFEQEVDRLGSELKERSKKILEFKNAHSDALPEALEYRMSRQSLLQERLSQLQREQTLLSDQRNRLIQVFKATGGMQLDDKTLTPEQRQLQDLREKLAQALVVYSPENPKVKLLKAQLAQLEATITGPVPGIDPASGDNPNTTMLDLQLAEIDSRISFIAEQITVTTNELDELLAAINATPANAIALEGLERDYSNVQLQYNNAVERLSQAATGERIELLSKGQRISVIEQAAVPDEPVAPNRPLIAGGGVLFAILAGIGSVILMEMLNHSVRRSVDLTKSLGITPLANIPYMRTVREAAVRRLVIATATVVVLVSVPGILFYIHTAYLPLDLIIARIGNSIGL